MVWKFVEINPKYQDQQDRFKKSMIPDQYWYHKGFASNETRGGGRSRREKKKGKKKPKTKNWHNTTSSEKMNGALSLALKAAVGVVRLIMVGR